MDLGTYRGNAEVACCSFLYSLWDASDFHYFAAYLKSRRLVDDRHLPPFNQNQAFCVLLFLMREVLGRDTACLLWTAA